MNRRSFMLSLLGGLLGLVSLVRIDSVLAKAETETFVLTMPVSETVENPCNGHLITLSGSLHVVIHSTKNPKRTVAVIQTTGQHMSGEDLETGVRYQQPTVSTQVTNVSCSAPSEHVEVSRTSLVGQGSADSLVIRHTLRVIVNAEGDITVNMEEQSAECH